MIQAKMKPCHGQRGLENIVLSLHIQTYKLIRTIIQHIRIKTLKVIRMISIDSSEDLKPKKLYECGSIINESFLFVDKKEKEFQSFFEGLVGLILLQVRFSK